MSEEQAMVTDSGGEISCSIAETNRLRASLGLKPLDITPKPQKEGSKDAPIDAASIRADEDAERQAEDMRAKIAEMKRQRLAQSKVMAKKGLGEVSDDEDDVASWVSKARKKQKKAANDMARRMAEQDEQDEKDEYTSRDLKGMKVSLLPSFYFPISPSPSPFPIPPSPPHQLSTHRMAICQQVQHEADTFKEGETVILTLADSRIVKREHGEGFVNDDEDVLENVNMSEFEKTAIAKEKAKKRAKYQNVDDDEFTAGGKSTNLLSKYDDFMVDGTKIGSKEDRRSIRLGDDGDLDLTKEQRQAVIRAKLSQTPGKV